MKKLPFKIITGFLICFGCCLVKGQSSKIAKEIAEKWIDLVNKHDSNGIAKLYADSIQINSPNWEGTKSGIAETKHVYSRYFSSTPDLTYKIINIIPLDTAVIVEYDFSGTLSSPEQSTPAYMRGKTYRLSACTVMLIRKSKIVRQNNYFDQVAFLRQMGFFDQK